MNNIFIECFLKFEDPRIDRAKKHYLLDIVNIFLYRILASSEKWEEIEDFKKANASLFKQFLDLPNGIPSHDRISRVFSLLNPMEFQECCLTWLNKIKEIFLKEIIAVDGKAIKGSKGKNKKRFIY